MKKLKLYAMAFAAMFFAASCQDEALVDSGQSQGNAEGAPAYLTITFTANGGSSTRAEGVNNGDTDGSADDSGHYNEGTTDENVVKTALVVVVPNEGEAGDGGSYFAKLYSTSATSSDNNNNSMTSNEDNQTQDEDPLQDAIAVINDATKTYSTEKSITINATATGIEYKVLVIVNPVGSLTSANNTTIQAGTNDQTIVQGLYNTIMTGTFSNTDDDDNTYVTAAEKLGNATSGFMMANREECITTVTTANTETNPAEARLDVERVLSKITLRPDSDGTADTNPDWTYEFESTIGGVSFQGVVVEGAYDTNDQGVSGESNLSETPNYQVSNFNQAKDKAVDEYGVSDPNEIWVLFNENKTFKGIYGKTEKTYDKDNKTVDETATTTKEHIPVFKRLIPLTQEEYDEKIQEGTSDMTNYYVAEKVSGSNTYDEEHAYTLVLNPTTPSEGTKQNISVKLEGYALVNLSKQVNYVRHRIPVNGSAVTALGTLGASEYLWTPYWDAKNAATFYETKEDLPSPNTDNKEVGDFKSGDNSTTWFYNTLANVAGESKNLTVTSNNVSFDGATYFKPLSGITTDTPNEVTGDKEQHSSSGGDLDGIGYTLGYCFENSVEAEMQKHGLTTGIAFVATMWNSDGTALERLYRYAGYVFESLTQLVSAYGGNVDDKMIALADKEAKNEDFDNTDIETMEELGIDRYEGNICYYYTSRIKHYDNNHDDSMGIMEFAIMRNNIYSLSISSISDIGDPFIDPTPGIDNESEKSALRIQAKIMPWIVRYNDIEF